MKMKRTFYPVGQGAFYSEIFHLGGGAYFSMVYDCGSGASLCNPDNALISQIKNLKFPHGTIDVLFLSHFHADHINGVKELSKNNKIKKIVIPLVEDAELFVCEKCNEKYDNSKLRQFCEALKDPKKLLFDNENKETQIIRVLPIRQEGMYSSSSENNIMLDDEEFEIDSISSDIEIKSGSILSVTLEICSFDTEK